MKNSVNESDAIELVRFELTIAIEQKEKQMTDTLRRIQSNLSSGDELNAQMARSVLARDAANLYVQYSGLLTARDQFDNEHGKR